MTTPHAPSASITWTEPNEGQLIVGRLRLRFSTDECCRDLSDAQERAAQRIVAAVNALSPLQGDPAEALAKARIALIEANHDAVMAADHAVRSDTVAHHRARAAMYAAAIAALGSPL